MGNCDFITKDDNEKNGMINKNNFMKEYIIARGGYGKVRLLNNYRFGKSNSNVITIVMP